MGRTRDSKRLARCVKRQFGGLPILFLMNGAAPILAPEVIPPPAKGVGEEQIRTLLAGLNTQDVADLRQRGLQIRQSILAAELPRDLMNS